MYRPSKNCLLCEKMTDCYFSNLKCYCCWSCKNDILLNHIKKQQTIKLEKQHLKLLKTYYFK